MSLLDDIKDLPIKKWGNYIYLPQQCKLVKTIAPQARQFIFDKGASEVIGHFIRDCPDILVDQMQFARQPYDTTYIEVELDALYEAAGKKVQYTWERDWKIGFLAHKGEIFTLTNTHTNTQAHISPVCTFDYEYRPIADDPLSDDSRVLLGSTWHALSDDQRNAFAQRFNVGYLGKPSVRDRALEIMLPAITGEARVYVACLLFLYQKRHLTLTDHGPRRALSKGKLRTYMAHTTVTIHLSEYEAVKRDLTNGERNSPRRHEVRTHYKHRQLTAGCTHEWVRVEEADNEQWRCTACAGLRWLCRSHLRGDGSIGFVTKHYEVKL